MMRYAKLDDTGRIVFTEVLLDGQEPKADLVEIDFPEGFDFANAGRYRWDGSKLIYDPLPEPEMMPSEHYASKQELLQTQIGLAEVFEMMIAMMGGM